MVAKSDSKGESMIPAERIFCTYLTGWLGTKEGEKREVREAKDSAFPIPSHFRKWEIWVGKFLYGHREYSTKWKKTKKKNLSYTLLLIIQKIWKFYESHLDLFALFTTNRLRVHKTILSCTFFTNHSNELLLSQKQNERVR